MYDVRALLNAGAVMRDGKKIELPAPIEAFIEHLTGVKDLEKTEIYELLRDYGWIGELGENELTVAIHKNPPRVTTRSSKLAEGWLFTRAFVLLCLTRHGAPRTAGVGIDGM